jgi:hypothetical protein
MSTSTERMRRLRERRAAGLIPIDGPAPLPADDRLLPAVEESIAALELGEDGQAAAALARRYASVIDGARDQAWALRWIGPLLLASLESLRATPMSRKDVRKPGPQRVTQHDQLRARRRPGTS